MTLNREAAVTRRLGCAGASWAWWSNLRRMSDVPPPPGSIPPGPTRSSKDLKREAKQLEKEIKQARPWYQKKRIIIPGGLLAGIVGMTALAGPVEDEAATTTTAEVTTTDTTEAAATTEAPATTAEVTTTAAEPETTTTEATTTTEFVLTVENAKVFAFPIVFDSTRDGFIEVLEEASSIEAVDRYVYDSDTGVVTVEVRSIWAGEAARADSEWEITQLFAFLYNTEAWLLDDPRFGPQFELILDSRPVVSCDFELMVEFEQKRAGRSDFDSTCR